MKRPDRFRPFRSTSSDTRRTRSDLGFAMTSDFIGIRVSLTPLPQRMPRPCRIFNSENFQIHSSFSRSGPARGRSSVAICRVRQMIPATLPARRIPIPITISRIRSSPATHRTMPRPNHNRAANVYCGTSTMTSMPTRYMPSPDLPTLAKPL